MKHIKTFSQLNESEEGNETTFTVRYEQRASDGDYENENKDFTDLDQAMKFAKEHYAPIDYETLDKNGKTVDSGYVDVTNKKLVSTKNSSRRSLFYR